MALAPFPPSSPIVKLLLNSYFTMSPPSHLQMERTGIEPISIREGRHSNDSATRTLTFLIAFLMSSQAALPVQWTMRGCLVFTTSSPYNYVVFQMVEIFLRIMIYWKILLICSETIYDDSFQRKWPFNWNKKKYMCYSSAMVAINSLIIGF